MIAECLIFLATAIPQNGLITADYIEERQWCTSIISRDVREHSNLLIEFFDEPEQLSTAVKVIWCESRGKTDAIRTAEGNNDSGLFQFVSWTWNWIAEEYDLPMWDEWVIMRWGKPYTEQKTYRHNIGFEQTRVQFTPYYNILFASILAEDIYGRTQWRDWSSSEWCWGDEKKWRAKWKNE